MECHVKISRHELEKRPSFQKTTNLRSRSVCKHPHPKNTFLVYRNQWSSSFFIQGNFSASRPLGNVQPLSKSVKETWRSTLRLYSTCVYWYITTTTAAALEAAYWRLKPTPRAKAKRRAVARSGWGRCKGCTQWCCSTASQGLKKWTGKYNPRFSVAGVHAFNVWLTYRPESFFSNRCFGSCPSWVASPQHPMDRSLVPFLVPSNLKAILNPPAKLVISMLSHI